MDAVAYLTAASTAVVLLSCWLSPQCCRLLAAVLLTHADTVEEARDFRQRSWRRHGAALGVLREASDE